MKALIRIGALSVFLVAARVFAGEIDTSSVPPKNVALVESQAPFSFEFDSEVTYAGSGDLHRGDLRIEDFDETLARVRFVLTPRTKVGILRMGVQTEYYCFGYGGNAALPDVLSSTSLIVGLDTQFSDSFLIRLEAQPGYYGTAIDDFGQDTFNVPLVIGGTYLFSSSLQLVFGVGLDALRKYPVLPGGGVRWKFAPQWTLNAVVPAPRLEYEVNSSLMLYGGADIRSTSYRVDKQFGTQRGDTSLNHAAITYDEVRTGVGLDWKVTSSIKVSAEAGCIPYRNFDFHRTQVRYRQDSIVPYGMLAFHAAF